MTTAPDRRDFTDERNRYVVELFAKGWHPWTAHVDFDSARDEAERRLLAGYPVRVLDVGSGGRIVL